MILVFIVAHIYGLGKLGRSDIGDSRLTWIIQEFNMDNSGNNGRACAKPKDSL